jgi:hypothetical protein
MRGSTICKKVRIVAEALLVKVPLTKPVVWGSVRE